jgi:adenosylcobyric acid synthase
VGVIPYLDQVFPAEDSLDLLDRKPAKANSELNIAVIRLPRIANFTDFDPLESEPSVTVKYLHPKQDLGHPDAVIIPGTKTTIADLNVLQKSGMAEAIQNYAASGGTVLGICGGFQMLGQTIADPEGMEGQAGKYQGLKPTTKKQGFKVVCYENLSFKCILTETTAHFDLGHQTRSCKLPTWMYRVWSGIKI